MIHALLARRRALRVRADREATELLTWLGEGAYAEARARMRTAQGHGDRADERLWSRVAVEIARRTSIEIGKQGAAKWPDWSRIVRGTTRRPFASSEQPVIVAGDWSGPASRAASIPQNRGAGPNRREIADRLVDISRGIAEISAGRSDATIIHNIGVSARQILDFTGRTPDLEQAVGELMAASEGVVIAPTVEELSRGTYPLAVEAAGRALRRLKVLVLGSTAP